MNWEALGAVGEIVGAVAVVLTLGYLAMQMRQNTAQLEQNAEEFRVSYRQQQHARIVEMNTAIFTHRDVGELIERGRIDFESLDGADRHRWTAFMTALFRSYEARHAFAIQGLERIRTARLQYFLEAASTRRFWRNVRETYETSFREYVDSMLSEIEAGESSGDAADA